MKFATEPTPLDLPLDHPYPKVRTYTPGRIDHVLAGPLVEAVHRLAIAQGTSLFDALLVGFVALLHRLTHQDEVHLAIPADGEPSDVLALRFSTTRGEPAAALLERVDSVMRDAVRHHASPAVAAVLFNYEEASEETCVAATAQRREAFEFCINAVDDDDRVTLECHYNGALLEEPTIRRWLAAYELLLGDWSANKDRTVGALDIGARNLLEMTDASYPQVEAHQLVMQQVARTPNAIAIVQGDRSITYAELAERAAELAAHLRAAGVTDQTLVGIHTSRTPEMVVAVLGALLAGGAYLPLDPAFPIERLRYMIADAKVQVVVTESGLADTFGDAKVKQILVDKLGSRPAHGQLKPRNRPEELAYVLYTSGSTGEPKGVAVSHRALVNFLTSMVQAPGLSSEDRLLAVTTLSFDIAGLDLFLPLIRGARIVLATKEQATDGAELIRLIADEGVTVLQATPSTWRLLIAAGWKGARSFKALCGGEALAPDLAHDIASRVSELWNMYGPTETTIWSTRTLILQGLSKVTLGYPIANTRLYVLDPDRNPVLPGVVGELYIAGDGLAREYLGKPDLTRERFVTVNAERAYRTGDLVRRKANGDLEFVGRADTQVKLRGFRIELGEVESALRSHPCVQDAVAIVREDRVGDPRLVGYVIYRRGSHVTTSDLRQHLRRTLPDYMVPQSVVEVEAFPLTPNNKVDRKRLPAPVLSPAVDRLAESAPTTASEKLVVAAYAEALGNHLISLHDNFFELGGQSLSCLSVIADIEKHTGKRLNPRVVLRDSIQQVAAALDALPTSRVSAQAADSALSFFGRLFGRWTPVTGASRL